MTLRIACDLDGTIADMDGALQRQATQLFGPDVDLHAVALPVASSEDLDEAITRGDGRNQATAPPVSTAETTTRPLTGDELRELWSHATRIENFWTTLDEIEPGTVARLWQLVSGQGWEVIFLTQRPPSAGEPTQMQSQRWLQTHGFELPSVFVMNGSRGRVADALALDAVLDDRSGNCLDVVADSKAMPMLIWRFPPDAVPAGIAGSGIQIVHSMADALDRLERIAAERARPRSFLGRLRHAIGLES